ncbi:flagellar biosynthesis protein FlhF [Glaciecola sp. 1036]|uniref:flagellar biosynthesis protein FlhF n=1 Tax=Alteromonadaceae TaxID=72275 RepID=UPI003D011926
MKIRRFFGKDMREALNKVKEELGGDAVIMSNKKTAQGVELVAAVDPTSHTPDPVPAKKPSKTTLREVIGEDDSDSLQALLQRSAEIAKENLNSAQANNSQIRETTSYNANTNSQQQISHQKKRADESMIRSPAFTDDLNLNDTQAASLTPPPSVLEPEQLDSIRAELESIKNVLKFQVSELSEERKKRNNPVHHYLKEQLTGMGISQRLCQQFIDFMPHKIDEKQGWKYLLNLLSNRIVVGGNDILGKAGVVALVGPTGTGKTTTLAKLAAKYAQKYGPDQVALVTIDTYRIAAYEQLATYGRIIGCSVKKAQNAEELNQILYQMRNKKLVLIDTAGFSQRDARLIEQLNEYENGLSVDIKKYLVLPAASQYRVLNETVKTYNNIDLTGCIFSKLDECYSLGEALSVIIENDLSLSYVTDGQRVPEDIKLADSGNLTLVAAKLYKKYGLSQQPNDSVAIAGGL